MHPEEHKKFKILGKEASILLWQQAYWQDYAFAGMLSTALPIPLELSTFLAWSQNAIDERLNELLLNWCDGRKNHNIGKHRDSVKGLVAGALRTPEQ